MMDKGVFFGVVLVIVLIIVLTTVSLIAPTGYYIIDKGHTLSHTDEYGFVHDEIFWFILHENKSDTTVVSFVNPSIWYTYFVGESFGYNIENSLPYINDAELAKYLEKAQ